MNPIYASFINCKIEIIGSKLYTNLFILLIVNLKLYLIYFDFI